jgi:hypothetical protein
MHSTSQQIKVMQLWEQGQREHLKKDIRRVVDNAIIADDHGDSRPLEMLERIANMDMAGGVTNYQQELKDALENARPGPQRVSFKRETERLFLQGQGIGALQGKYRELYGEDPLPLSAVGNEKKKREYINGLIEAIIDKKLEA